MHSKTKNKKPVPNRGTLDDWIPLHTSCGRDQLGCIKDWKAPATYTHKANCRSCAPVCSSWSWPLRSGHFDSSPKIAQNFVMLSEHFQGDQKKHGWPKHRTHRLGGREPQALRYSPGTRWRCAISLPESSEHRWSIDVGLNFQWILVHILSSLLEWVEQKSSTPSIKHIRTRRAPTTSLVSHLDTGRQIQV